MIWRLPLYLECTVFWVPKLPKPTCPGFVINGTYGYLAEIAKATRKHKSNVEYTEIHSVGKSRTSFLTEKMEKNIQQTSKGEIG